MLSDYESAGFAELLSLLLEHRVALSSGGGRWLGRGHGQRGDDRRGPADLPRPSSGASPPARRRAEVPERAFRPVLRWALAAGQDQGSLVESLRNLAPMYRKRGAFQAEKLQLFLPTVLMIVDRRPRPRCFTP